MRRRSRPPSAARPRRRAPAACARGRAPAQRAGTRRASTRARPPKPRRRPLRSPSPERQSTAAAAPCGILVAMPGRVCFVVGARPNFMKAAPVLRALRSIAPATEPLLVHTGQHYDAAMSDVFLDELELPVPDVFLNVGSGSHGEQTARALVGVEAVLIEHEPSLVVVSGDVNSTLAGALAAAKLRIPVAHIEAGLRSFDPTMPEEHNRRLTDHVSAVLLAHSQSAVDNLAAEGIVDGVHLVGNTMVDSLLEHVETARARRVLGGVRTRRRRLRARDAAPAGARRRTGAPRRDGRRARRSRRLSAARLPGAPANGRAARRSRPPREDRALARRPRRRRSAISTSSGSRRRRVSC